MAVSRCTERSEYSEGLAECEVVADDCQVIDVQAYLIKHNMSSMSFQNRDTVEIASMYIIEPPRVEVDNIA